MQMYIRLLTYPEAEKAIKKMEKIGGYAAITAGGVSLSASQGQIDSLIDWLEDNVGRYELSFNHPCVTKRNIINQLSK